MFSRFVAWMFSNKLAVLLLILIFYLLFFGNRTVRPFFPSTRNSSRMQIQPQVGMMGIDHSAEMPFFAEEKSIGRSILPPEPAPDRAVPPVNTQDRKVITDTNLSLLVKDVRTVIDAIKTIATSFNGFFVDSFLSVPEGAANGTITVRVPIQQREEVLTQLRNLAVKTISERVVGTDVTDQYVDLEARIAVLAKTQTKFQEIFDKAETVQEMLSVQRELLNLQDQLDQLEGQKQYLEKTSELSKITVYLSTDELSLPYAPEQSWRPQAIFKQAVRSLVAVARKVGTALIWIGVYAPVWLTVGAGYIWYSKLKTK